MRQKPSPIEIHNQEQRAYFTARVKRTMLPTDTPYVRRHIEELVRAGKICLGDRVLELGCGMGRYTLPLAARGFQVEGMDLTPFLLEKLGEADGGQYGIRLHCADVLTHDSTLDGQFDVVAGLFTLHHLHDLPGCFAAMRRLLKPGGRVVFLEPNAFNVLYYAQILLSPNMTWKGDRGLINMRPAVVCRAMATAGLKEIAVERFGFFPPFLTNRSWGPRVERVLEAFPPWRPFLPFQLFCAVNP
jgi:SAM-dependent methyltransferase